VTHPEAAPFGKHGNDKAVWPEEADESTLGAHRGSAEESAS
jgi:hypothetical protein